MTAPPVIPNLQSAIEALHTKILSGDAAAAAAIATGLTGPATSVPPEALPLLADALTGDYGETYSRIWDGDYGTPEDEHGSKGDASLADWMLANEFVYQALRHKIADESLGEIIEQMMRASGAYRPKYDRPWTVTIDGETIHTTYLGVTIGKAIKRQQQRRDDYRAQHPDIKFTRTEGGAGVAEELGESEPVPLVETINQELTRLRRENANLRAVEAVQMTVIRAERAENQALKAKLTEIRDLMAVPSKRLSYPAKCLAVVADSVFEATAAYRADPDKSKFVQVRYADLAAKMGGSESTVAREMNKTLCTSVEHPTVNAAAPIWKRTDFVEREIDGERRPTSETIVALKTEGSLLSAVLAYQPDEERKHGGARPKGCPDHPAADLIIRSTTHCAECDRQLGDTRETLRHQVDVLGAGPDAPVLDSYSGHQVDVLGADDGGALDEYARKVVSIEVGAHRLRHQDASVGANLGQIKFTHDQDPPPPDAPPAPTHCIWGDAPLAPGERVYCEHHRQKVDAEPWPAVAGAEE